MNNWIMAARPKTLMISIIPVLIGTILAKGQPGGINWALAFLTVLVAVLIQTGINMVNDGLDFKSGADNEERLGFKRVTQAGLLTYKQVMTGGLLCFALAFLFGIPLIWAAGWPLLIAIVLSIVFGYLYTGGPYPLGYYGLGELFVFIFFGFVITCSAYYLQTGTLDANVLLASTQIGLLAVIPIVINNTRDIATDLKANKITLSARYGLYFSRWEITLLAAGAYLVGIAWLFLGHPFMTFLQLMSIPFFYYFISKIWTTEPGREYNQYLVMAPLGQLIFCLLLAAGYLLK